MIALGAFGAPGAAGPLPVPGLEGFFLCEDGGVAIALPQKLRRAAGGRCCCEVCRGAPAIWDTLRVHPKHSTGWLCHWPQLRAEAVPS